MPITVEVLQLGSVRLPANHPRAADRTCLIQAFLIHHPDGLILVDTGCADDNPIINEMYSPDVVSVIGALNAVNIDERDVVAIVNTHLHFDHCGQNRLFPNTPVWVQQAELAAASQPHFTVPGWAEINPARQRLVDGDAVIADGLTLIATPGHTPGHQSLLIESDQQRELLVGQACYTCEEFLAGEPEPADMHDKSLLAVGQESLDRLRSLGSTTARFSHDRRVCQT